MPDAPSINDVIIRLDDLPALPAVAADLVNSMDDDELDLGELVSKMERDQALATKTVRVANSPFFGMMGKISSVRQAATVIEFAHHPLARPGECHVKPASASWCAWHRSA